MILGKVLNSLLPPFGNHYLLKVVGLDGQSLIQLAAVVAGVRRC